PGGRRPAVGQGRHGRWRWRRQGGGAGIDRSQGRVHDAPPQTTDLIGWLASQAEGFAGSKVLPSKKVSTPRLSEAGAFAPTALAASRQRSARLTLPTRALASVEPGSTPQRMSSVRNQRSCDLKGKL